MGDQVQVSAPNKSDDQGLTKLFQQSEYHSSSLGEDIGHTGLNQQQDSIIMNDHKGRIPLSNQMNFWKNSKWPLTPPPFLENYIANLFIMDMVAFMQGGIGQMVLVNIS